MLAKYKKASQYALALYNIFGDKALDKIKELRSIQYLTPYPREGLLKQIKKFNLEFLKEFVDILIKRNDLGILKEIEEALQKMDDRIKGIKRIEIFSPLELSEEQKRDILSLFNGDNIVIEEVLDKTLLCGFRIKHCDRVVDLSAKNELNILKRLL